MTSERPRRADTQPEYRRITSDRELFAVLDGCTDETAFLKEQNRCAAFILRTSARPLDFEWAQKVARAIWVRPALRWGPRPA